MEIKKNLTKEEIESKARAFMDGIASGTWYIPSYIVAMDWTQYDTVNKKHDFLGVELRCVPHDYSGGEYRFIAQVETCGENRYSDREDNYYSKRDIVKMITKAVSEELS